MRIIRFIPLVGIVAVAILLLGIGVAIGIRFWSADRAGDSASTAEHAMPSMGQAGHAMRPVDISSAPVAPIFARGQQPLDFKIVSGVKEYRLTPQLIRWSILPTVQVGAYTYNGTVPGPMLRLTVGDRVRFILENQLPEPTSVHWHGLQIDNVQDGVAGVTQPPVQPGETFTYEWTVPPTPGSFFYHSHFQADRQQPLGLYGVIILEPDPGALLADVDLPILLGEWKVTNQGTLPAMDFPGMEPNFFTINGKSYPETESINVKVGQKIRLRLVGSGQFIHPMHLHGQPFKIVASDGNPIPEATQLIKDTVLVGPGERYDIEFVARAPGKWLFHCHINHHTTNNGAEEQGGGGLTMIVNVYE